MNFLGLFKKQASAIDARSSKERIREIGTPTRAVVTDVINKRNGWVVIAVYEDRWIGTQNVYTSEVLKEKPCVYVGGEVIVYVDDASGDGSYFVDC